MLKTEIVELLADYRMAQPCTINRASHVRHYMKMHKAALVLLLDAITNPDKAEVDRLRAEARQIEYSSWRKVNRSK